jgi:hypothetical protein
MGGHQFGTAGKTSESPSLYSFNEWKLQNLQAIQIQSITVNLLIGSSPPATVIQQQAYIYINKRHN